MVDDAGMSAGPDVTLIRHGETEWSRSGQHTGRTDLPLLPEGERQAEALRPALGAFAAVYCSPMQRARRTAELAGLQVTEITDDLREWDYGEFEGMTTPEIQERQPGWAIWTGPWPGGESAADVAARCDRLIERVRATPDEGPVAFVAHGHILRAMTARWLGFDVADGKRFVLGTATLSILGWEHDWPAVSRWNSPG